MREQRGYLKERSRLDRHSFEEASMATNAVSKVFLAVRTNRRKARLAALQSRILHDEAATQVNSAAEPISPVELKTKMLDAADRTALDKAATQACIKESNEKKARYLAAKQRAAYDNKDNDALTNMSEFVDISPEVKERAKQLEVEPFQLALAIEAISKMDANEQLVTILNLCKIDAMHFMRKFGAANGYYSMATCTIPLIPADSKPLGDS